MGNNRALGSTGMDGKNALHKNFMENNIKIECIAETILRWLKNLEEKIFISSAKQIHKSTGEPDGKVKNDKRKMKKIEMRTKWWISVRRHTEYTMRLHPYFYLWTKWNGNMWNVIYSYISMLYMHIVFFFVIVNQNSLHIFHHLSSDFLSLLVVPSYFHTAQLNDIW